MNVKKIIEVCRMRQLNKIGCRRCEYMGQTCEHAKNILRVDKPANYNELNKEEKLNERFNKKHRNTGI